MRAGKVRYVGASNMVDWRLEEARWLAASAGQAQYCCVQQRYSYVRPQAGAIYDPHAAVNDELLDYCRNRGLTILAYSPLLSGAYSRSDRPLPEQYLGPDTDLRLKVLREVAAEAGATAEPGGLRVDGAEPAAGDPADDREPAGADDREPGQPRRAPRRRTSSSACRRPATAAREPVGPAQDRPRRERGLTAGPASRLERAPRPSLCASDRIAE